MFILPIYNAILTSIDESETKRYAGLSKTDFDPSLIRDACLEAQLLSKPQGIWQIYDYNHCTHTIMATQPVQLQGKSITKHLQKAEKVIVLAVTIGEAVEKAVTKHFEQDAYTHSVLLDAAATTAVEMAADLMEKTIQQRIYPQGYRTLMRFSPGYGDWDIHFQPEMMQLACAAEIGIELTDSMMLVPRKSVTAIIGLVPNEGTACISIKHDCKNCNKTDCIARKETFSS